MAFIYSIAAIFSGSFRLLLSHRLGSCFEASAARVRAIPIFFCISVEMFAITR
jgi:hypothetical protein